MEERVVCRAMLITGATQDEIPQLLGTTRKSVDRRLSRVRRRAEKLAAADLIVVPSICASLSSSRPDPSRGMSRTATRLRGPPYSSAWVW
ncbi:hypothetical protein ACIHFC_29560 [Streptomyces sp. NPDC052013]|uniref:hypothetical protein n=1 Tax=Streptomyces sp. NPDC052013 TaxID=3365679 RepID=UPI0037D8A8AF